MAAVSYNDDVDFVTSMLKAARLEHHMHKTRAAL
jgi:hypothetical protein